MFSLICKSAQKPLRASRLFHVSALRSNLIQDLYIQQLKAFTPKPLTAADAEAATKSWKLPAAAAIPAIESEGADALAEYDASKVEVSSPAAAGEEAASETYSPDDWFVLEEDDVPL